MSIPRWLTVPVGQAARAVGRTYDYLTPGAGTGTLTNAGRSITDPNAVYTGGIGGLFNNKSDFTVASAQPVKAPVLGVQTIVPSTGQYTDTNYGGGSAYGVGDGTDLSYFDDQESILRNLLASAQRTRENGLTQLGDTYNREAGRLNEGQGAALSNLETQREDTTRNKTNALNQTDTNARNLANTVRRILGLAGGANSSAYQIAAPNAIAREASTNRSNILDTYGRNFRDLGTAEAGAQRSYRNAFDDLMQQRREQEQGLQQGVLQQEQGIYGNLADLARQRAQAQGGGYAAARAASAPLVGEINARQSALDNLFNQYRNPTYNVSPVQVATPDLAQYNVDRAALQAQAQAGPEDYSPYAQFLKKRMTAPLA